MNADRAIGIGAFVTAGTILVAFAVFGLTLNTTPSYPRGLWRQVAAAELPVIRGRMALACPPPAPAFEEAARRGYMGGPGSCPNGYRPIMKRIMAVAGGVGAFHGAGGALRGHGGGVPNSARQPRDAAGRSLSPWAGGPIPPHQALLMSDYTSTPLTGATTARCPRPPSTPTRSRS